MKNYNGNGYMFDANYIFTDRLDFIECQKVLTNHFNFVDWEFDYKENRLWYVRTNNKNVINVIKKFIETIQ